MNNKDFINALSLRLGKTAKGTQTIVNGFVNDFADKLDDNTSFSVQGFGNFEVKKKLERISVNPATKKRKIIPPKLVLSFKPSTILKEKVKQESERDE